MSCRALGIAILSFFILGAIRSRLIGTYSTFTPYRLVLGTNYGSTLLVDSDDTYLRYIRPIW